MQISSEVFAQSC